MSSNRPIYRPIYRCRLCGRAWTGIADIPVPERTAAEPHGTVPHLCPDDAIGVADVVGFRVADENDSPRARS